MTPAQCRAARALTDMTPAELAGHAVVPTSLIADYETGASAARVALPRGVLAPGRRVPRPGRPVRTRKGRGQTAGGLGRRENDSGLSRWLWHCP
jgi:hypothetical protein